MPKTSHKTSRKTSKHMSRKISKRMSRKISKRMSRKTSRSLQTRRGLLETVTIKNLRKIAKKHNIALRVVETKTGIISKLMDLPKITLIKEGSKYSQC